MKNIKSKIKNYLFVSILLISSLIANAQFTPINVNTSLNTDNCNANGGVFGVSIPNEALTGDNIPLNITLPGTLDPSCDVNIDISYSSPNNKLSFVTSGNVAFTQTGNTLTTTNSLPGNDGQNFNVFFKFLNQITCDGEMGTITVSINACGQICTTSVTVGARAANYWDISKQFIAGDLTCGTSKWLIKIKNSNPNPSGFGNYKIQGTITENPSVPVLSNAIIPINLNYGNHYRYITLQNCQDEGTAITNTANYQFTLGGGCGSFNGAVSAVSPLLQSPNASISFVKSVYSSSGTNVAGVHHMSAGCQGIFAISINNNGNVPWTGFTVSDNLNIPGLTITAISLPSGWTSTPPISPVQQTNYTFSSPSNYVLTPGNTSYLYFYFTLDGSTPINTILSNTATLSYQAFGVGSSGSGTTNTTCANVNCPTIDTSIQNDSATTNIKVVAPVAKPKIKKCILNPPTSSIYQIGDIIHFQIRVSNQGSGSLSTQITDALGAPNQNLQILNSSFNYSYYENNSTSASYNCNTTLTNQVSPIPFAINENLTDLQNPSIDFTLPGICNLYRANYLVIEFDAEVLPQLHGSKTNRAYLDSGQSSAVSYTIDQVGGLEVNKRADVEFVENGQNFNYIIEVSNNGSVPMNTISITDQIPSCVSASSEIEITDFSGSPISFTQTGNLTINIDPSVQLIPGQPFIITIPATKTGGGNCCNESVTASGTMATSGVQLEANFGSASEPAACVKSTMCCDIPDFEAHLYTNASGGYSVEINGGAVPIQEVDIAVIDYHVEYSSKDCQPQDMGVFGNISTNTTLLNSLILDPASNDTSNLTWLLGEPTVLDTAVPITISGPNVLDLECCDVSLYFCIKVTVKDVNCNVCEKVICLEKPKPECNLRIKNVKNSYCINDSININWTGTSTSGNVAIYLMPASGVGSPILLASNQPETGSMNWTIPTNIKPCDTKWKLAVADTENPEDCHEFGNVFVIKCCETSCACGDWETHSIVIEQKFVIDANLGDLLIKKSQKKKLIKIEPSQDIECGGSVKLKPSASYHFTPPVYICNPSDCDVTYEWQVQILDTNQVIGGVGNSFDFTFEDAGKYKVTFTPICGGKKCKSCEILVYLP